MIAFVRRKLCSSGFWNTLLAGISFVLLTLALPPAFGQTGAKTEAPPWTAPARAARKQNPISADAKSVEAGKVLYTAACLPCHGTAGKGDGPAAAALERNGAPVRPGNLSSPKLWDQSDGALFWKISEGNTPMPSFQESFTEEQRWQIVNYVRTLAAKETKPGGKQ